MGWSTISPSNFIKKHAVDVIKWNIHFLELQLKTNSNVSYVLSAQGISDISLLQVAKLIQ